MSGYDFGDGPRIDANAKEVFADPGQLFVLEMGVTLGRIEWILGFGGGSIGSHFSRSYSVKEPWESLPEQKTLDIESLSVFVLENTVSYILPVNKYLYGSMGGGWEYFSGSGEGTITNHHGLKSSEYNLVDVKTNVFYVQPAIGCQLWILAAELRARYALSPAGAGFLGFMGSVGLNF